MGISCPDISKMIDKNVLSIKVSDLKKAINELNDEYVVAFKTSDCLLESVVRKYGYCK